MSAAFGQPFCEICVFFFEINGDWRPPAYPKCALFSATGLCPRVHVVSAVVECLCFIYKVNSEVFVQCTGVVVNLRLSGFLWSDSLA